MESFKAQNGVEFTGSIDVKTYQPKSLHGDVDHASDEKKEKPAVDLSSPKKEVSRQNARFSLDPSAKRSLGIENEENKHLEGKIQAEVERRLAEVGKKAYDEGFAKGKTDGEALAKTEFQTQSQPTFDRFNKITADFEDAKQEIFKANEQFLIQLVFNVSRMVILKELKSDSEYIKRLCVQLIERIGAKDFIKIKIGKDDQANIDSLKEYLKHQFVDLKNIQIEVSEEITGGGCKVETDLARIEASVQTQLDMIKDTLGGV